MALSLFELNSNLVAYYSRSIIASIVRIPVTARPNTNDPTWQQFDGTFWAYVLSLAPLNPPPGFPLH